MDKPTPTPTPTPTPPSDDVVRAMAKSMYEVEGEIEIDDNAVVSHGADPGAYVAAWVWVPFDDEDEDESDE